MSEPEGYTRVTLEVFDKLLEEKLETPEGRVKVARYAAAYVRDQIRNGGVSEGSKYMFEKVAKILQSFSVVPSSDLKG